MKEKRTQHRSGGFMEGKGFYIVLFLCIAAIGISGYYLFSGLTAPTGGFGPEASTAVSGQAELEKDQTTTQTPAQEDTQQEEPSDDSAQETAKQEDQTPAQQPEDDPTAEDTTATSTAYVWPVQGSVDRDFSLEVFAYDATMGDWRTHSGLDIAAELGAPVSACGKGTVSEVSSDPMMGTTITIDHGRGMESVYSNLAESVNVQVGDEVEAGTVLGSVGTTAIAESASPSHLHFEMIEYDVPIDPLNYLH